MSEATTTSTGRAARPLAPAHQRGRSIGGDQAISWIQRSRIGGDVWDGEVPLGEAAKTWRLKILNDSAVVREVMLSAPGYTYAAALRAADLATGSAGILSVEVAQGSATAGWGGRPQGCCDNNATFGLRDAANGLSE